MTEGKTRPGEQSVDEFLNGVEDPGRRDDCFELLRLMGEITGERPRMWGTMVGFGSYHYRYASGHEGDFFRVGFAPRKRNLTMYLNCYLDEDDELLSRLGKHRIGKACIYLNGLDDIDEGVLRQLITRSLEQLRTTYG